MINKAIKRNISRQQNNNHLKKVQMEKVSIKGMTPEVKAKLLEELQADKKNAATQKREDYESLRKDLVTQIMGKVEPMADNVRTLFDFVSGEITAFYGIMNEYGQLSREGQMNYKITDGNYRVEVKTNKIKKFDERAELAASRLIEFLKGWIKDSAKGTDDPMYQLTMSLISRNQHGDLDYKSISKLYEYETKFNSTEYSVSPQRSTSFKVLKACLPLLSKSYGKIKCFRTRYIVVGL